MYFARAADVATLQERLRRCQAPAKAPGEGKGVVLVCQPAVADPIYKWVDSKGRSTYSSTPPPGGVKADQVKTPPPPTQEQVRQAEERLKRTKEQASELGSQRLKQEEKETEEARLPKEQQPQPPTATEKPAYSPRPGY